MFFVILVIAVHIQKYEKRAAEDKERYAREMKEYQAKGGAAANASTSGTPKKSNSRLVFISLEQGIGLVWFVRIKHIAYFGV